MRYTDTMDKNSNEIVKSSKKMRLARLLFIVAIIILAVWLLGNLLKFAAWLISGLAYVAALVVVIGLVVMYFDRRRH